MSSTIRPLIAGNWKMNGLRASMAEFEALIDRLADHGQPSSTMVLSSPLAWRPVRPSV